MADPNEMAKKFFQTGNQAISSQNWEYAVSMLTQCVKLVPDNLMYRQLLRSSQRKKLGDDKKKVGMMVKPKVMAVQNKVKNARKKELWDEVDQIAEQGLALNPWDGFLNAAVGDACNERGYEDVAIFCYQVAISKDVEPENKKYLYMLAELLKAKGRYDEAIAVLTKIQKIDPLDQDVRAVIAQTRGDQAIDKGGYEDAKGTRDVTEAELNKRLKRGEKQEEKADAPGMSTEADLQHAIRKDPENRDLYVKLGDYYRREGRYDDTLEQYTKANELAGGDSSLKEIMEDVELEKMNKEFDELSMAASRNKEDKELRKKAKEMGRHLLDQEIDIMSKRVKRYPADMKLKYELARRYRRLERWSEAIPLLQQASTDPRLEVDALVGLGKCFLKDQRPQMALRQFKKVEPKLNSHDRPDTFKEVHYYMGRLEEQASNRAAAQDHYSEVLAADYDYRDVRARLERLEGGGSGRHKTDDDNDDDDE